MLKHIDEYRDPKLAEKLVDKILSAKLDRRVNFMEVCGTHTMAISRFGIRKLLNERINLISGPGCPVCVTTTDYMDKAIEYAKSPQNIITTFGDMFRVPGTKHNLELVKTQGSDIRIVYSPLDSIKIAKENPSKQIIFLAVGFETTTPTIAGMIKTAEIEKIKNLYVLCANKVIPPALEALLSDREVKVDGFILPAHVSTLIGYDPYRFIVDKYGMPCVITGFEALDILAGVDMLLEQIKNKTPKIENEYKRFAKPSGNKKAMSLVYEIFETSDASWRGFGTLPGSGLKLKSPYRDYDIEYKNPAKIERTDEPKGCLCGRIIKGLNKPTDCGLFAKKCTPENPIGACMVSSEGTCAAYYKYER